MKITSMDQASVEKIPPPDLDESQPLLHEYYCYAMCERIRLHIFLRAAAGVVTMSVKRVLMLVVMATTMFALGRAELHAGPLAQETAQVAQAGHETAAELQQLVAPIALYPDELIAQILAAATYPTEIVQADRWIQQHSNLQGEQIAAEVNEQSWDPSVKALTEFPSVLANLDKNLSWTSALGDAYFNQQQDVLDAVQVMRRRAEDSGTLRGTPQEKVIAQGSTIIIEPVERDVCYLPIYDPWLAYGAPIDAYPGYIYDAWFGPPFISFGPGIGLGFFGRFDWGWPAWGFNWGRRVVVFNHNTYVSRSRTFFRRFPDGGRGDFRPGRNGTSFEGNHQLRGIDRNRPNGIPSHNYDRNLNQGRPIPHFDRGGSGQPLSPGSEENRREYRGFGEARPNMGTRSGAFSGFGEGGVERNSASRGRSSFGGAGGSVGGRRSGGGGVRGGGGGGRHR